MTYRTKADMPDYTDPPPPFNMEKSFPGTYRFFLGIKVLFLFILKAIGVLGLSVLIPYYFAIVILTILKVQYSTWDVGSVWATGALMIFVPIFSYSFLHFLGDATIKERKFK